MSAKNGAGQYENDEPTDGDGGTDGPSAGESGADEGQGGTEAEVGSTPEDVIDTPEDVIERLAAQGRALEARLRTVSAAYKEQQDEMRATRDRLERQAQAKEELRRGEVVATLFEPFQNLRRSVSAVRSGATADEVARGLEIVENQILEAFHRLGLEEVPGKGAKFDPSLHEAISTIPVTDPALDDVVIDVFSSGYRIGSRLIQPARVVIGKLQQISGEA
jgi:molecular chaperone GrpE